MSVSYPTGTNPRFMASLSMTVNVLCALFAAQMAWQDSRYILLFVAIASMAVLPVALARWRMRKLLRSGDVKRLIGTWQGTIDRVMYPETMAPLMAATAYAAYGWLEPARDALERAVRGPAWEAALEQRLFVETLLDTFEGERSVAITKAELLEQMPVPMAGVMARRRIALLRRGIAALARAFAHQSLAADGTILVKASKASPLVHWAMRYAAAIVAVDRGDHARVRRLLEGAPTWPQESAFRLYHEELIGRSAT